MLQSLARLAADHSLGFVVTSVAICVVAGWLVARLMRNVSDAKPSARWRWMTGVAVVAGLGVWTTHFIAMLGYRPDMMLGYEGATTALSALVAVLLVGGPLAVVRLQPSWRWRVGIGATAGFGIGAMHYAGMAAIEGCLRTYSPLASGLATGIGACCLALACGLPSRLATTRAVCALFTAAVGGTHFIAIAGTSLEPVGFPSGLADGHLTLSIFTAAGAAVLFLGAFLTILTAQRFDAQERAHSTVLKTALDNMSNGLLYLDANDRVRLYNRRYLEIYGFEHGDDLIGLTADGIIDLIGDRHDWNPERRTQARERLEGWRVVDRFTSIDYPMDDVACPR